MAPQMRMTQVHSIIDISPHMRRIVLTGDSLFDFPTNKEGAYVKAIFPNPSAKNNMPILGIYFGFKKWLRSYTIRHFDQKDHLLSLDFAINDHHGLASNWAVNAKKGDYLGIAGPGEIKHTGLDLHQHLLFGDLTALPVISTILEKLSAQALGNAYIQIPEEADKQTLDSPKGVKVHWIITDNKKTDAFLDGLKSQPKDLRGTAIFIATEASVVKQLKAYLNDRCHYSKHTLYASAYWNDKR